MSSCGCGSNKQVQNQQGHNHQTGQMTTSQAVATQIAGPVPMMNTTPPPNIPPAQQMMNTTPAHQAAMNNMYGGDTDSHGCKPSAGYSWCESLQKCVRPWETPCPIGGNTDAHGCYTSAGYQWCDSLKKCYRPFEENCPSSPPPPLLPLLPPPPPTPCPSYQCISVDFRSGRKAKCGECKIKLRHVNECEAQKILNCNISKSVIIVDGCEIPISIEEIDYYCDGNYICITYDRKLSCKDKRRLESFGCGVLKVWC